MTVKTQKQQYHLNNLFLFIQKKFYAWNQRIQNENESCFFKDTFTEL